MTIADRIRIYLSRNVIRTIIVLIIVFVLGMLVSGGLIMKNSAAAVSRQFDEKAGIYVFMNYDLLDDITDYSNWYSEKKNHRDTFESYRKNLDDLLQDNNVSEVSYSIYKLIYSSHLSISGRKTSSLEEMVLFGVDSYLFTDIMANDINLTEGRTFTDEEIRQGSYVCLVNEDLTMDGEKIAIGDSVPVEISSFSLDDNRIIISKNTVKETETVYLTVIGKFHANEGMFALNDDSSRLACARRIYVPVKVTDDCQKITQRQIREDQEELTPSAEATNPYYPGITDVKISIVKREELDRSYESLLNRFSELNRSAYNTDSEGNIKKEYFRMEKSTDAYDRMAWVMNTIISFSSVVLNISVLGFTLIMIPLIYLIMKKRQNEIGILMSMGEKKSVVIRQVIIEIMVIALIGFIMSGILSYRIAEPIRNVMIDNVREAESQTQTTDDEGNRIQRIMGVTEEDLIEMFEIQISIQDIVNILILEFGITLVSTTVCIIYISGFSVRKVMIE